MVKRKLLSAGLALTMLASVIGGCGKKEGNASSTASSSVASDEGKVLNIYCWNEEFKTRMKAHYPGYEEVNATTGKIGEVTVNWITTPSDNNAYQNALDEALLKQGEVEADKKVDLFLIEADYALKYVDTDYTLDVVNDLGISKEQLANQFQYTQDVVTDKNGNLKGVSWQASPGAMIYRRDVAKKVFGTDDPAEIQKSFSDWDKFLESAKKLKEAGYQVTSSTTDTYRVFSNNVTSKWVGENNKINIDENIKKWVELSKKMVDEGYTNTYEIFSDDWSKGMTTAGNVFSYFGPAWLIDFTLVKYDLNGQWGITTGPQGFYWGGTWVCGANGTDNKTLVKDIITKMTCDKDTLEAMIKEDNEFANNKLAIKEVNDAGNYKNKVLGGQNPLGIYSEGAEKISLQNATAYDAGCNEEFQKAMKNYYKGTATYEEALELFYKNVEVKYPELKR